MAGCYEGVKNLWLPCKPGVFLATYVTFIFFRWPLLIGVKGYLCLSFGKVPLVRVTI